MHHEHSPLGTAQVEKEGGDSYEQRVTPLELFFDLVFVFALTQVTGFLSHHLTWIGMLQGAALLAVLWSSWAVYSWLTNAVPAEDVIPARIVIFCAMAAMFVASLAVPGAFGQYGVLFGTAYFVVQLLQVLLYSLATGDTPGQRRAILRLAPGLVGAPVLMIVAGLLDGYAQGRSGQQRSFSATAWRSSMASRDSGFTPGTSQSATASLSS
jgi:low temperature requirement protein LtrA